MTKWTDVKKNMNQWMGALSDSTLLSELSIPGTHDTMTWQGTSAPGGISKTQNYALCKGSQGSVNGGQLESGVRFLDIRLGLYDKINMGFALFHGVDSISYGSSYSYTHVDLDGNSTAVKGGKKFFQESVLDHCITFLRNNPSECIVMSVKHERFNNNLAFAEKFEKKVKANADWFYTENAIPNLGQVRGKIVLIRRYDSGSLGIDASEKRWPDDNDAIINATDDNPVRLAINDHFNENDTKKKWPKVQSYMKEVRNDTLVFNFTSIAYQVLRNPKHYADIMNPLANEYLDKQDSPNKVGFVIVDYITSELTDSIVRTNFTTTQRKYDMFIDTDVDYKIICDPYFNSDNAGFVGMNTSKTLKCNDTSPSAGIFRFIKKGNSYAIKLRDEERYCCAANEGHVTLNRKKIGDWELFDLEYDQEENNYKIKCKRDQKYWYTKSDGAIHHKDHVSRYVILPLKGAVITDEGWKEVAHHSNGGSTPFPVKVNIKTGTAMSDKTSNLVKSVIGAELKLTAGDSGGWGGSGKFEETHEYKHEIEKTDVEEMEQSIEFIVSPHKEVTLYQYVLSVTIAGFSANFSLVSWKTVEKDVVEEATKELNLV